MWFTFWLCTFFILILLSLSVLFIALSFRYSQIKSIYHFVTCIMFFFIYVLFFLFWFPRYIEERSFRRFVEACLEETIVLYVDRLLTQVKTLFLECYRTVFLQLYFWRINVANGRFCSGITLKKKPLSA